MADFTPVEYWKALILYGLNQATYKIALGNTLLHLSKNGCTSVSWQELSRTFLEQYINRLSADEPSPQQANPARLTVMERIVQGYQCGQLTFEQSIDQVGSGAFNDVIRRFHNLGNKSAFQGMFYRFDFGNEMVLTDELHLISEAQLPDLEAEIMARWSLLEGAFSMQQTNFQLSNDIRLTYITNGYRRKDLTKNIPFLQGYQSNLCFYCGEPIFARDIHVDHVLPRQVVQHDAIWNLVLGHSFCNEQKLDRLVGEHYIHKLIARNENIIGSNHPWKRRIISALGSTASKRSSTLRFHYEQVKKVLGNYYWGGTAGYRPDMDPFYQKLITVLNNPSQL